MSLYLIFHYFPVDSQDLRVIYPSLSRPRMSVVHLHCGYNTPTLLLSYIQPCPGQVFDSSPIFELALFFFLFSRLYFVVQLLSSI